MSEYVYVNAGNDRNGNARRGWIEYQDGCQIEFYPEDCIGHYALPPEGRPIRSVTALQITITNYRELLSLSRSGIPT